MRPAYRNTIMGQAPYSVTDRKWNAVTMIYQNPGSGVTYPVIYDAALGPGPGLSIRASQREGLHGAEFDDGRCLGKRGQLPYAA